MTVIKDLVDEQQQLASAKTPWDKYHRDISAWVLPQTEHFDTIVNTGDASASVAAVVGFPVASERSKHIYDMTSLWGIDRLTAGLISLKTPESDFWHDLSSDDDFQVDQSHDELVALEQVRNYLFKVRSNPKSGFWPSHRAAMRSMCAYGDGWCYIAEQMGGRVPFTYEYMAIPELFPAVDSQGNPNRMYHVFAWSAAQIVDKWGDKAGGKIVDMASDPKRRHNRIQVMQGVRPRSDEKNRNFTSGAQFASFYCLPNDDILIGEGGYFEFPFSRYAWAQYGQKPFCEGPVAIALSEIQSINEMAKNELLAASMLLRPPLGTHGKNFMRLNFNPGATNPGLISGDGRPLFQALNAGIRPDFASTIMEGRRNNLREALYLNLWQVLLQDVPGETATEAMLRAQEKGEMLGPVGISLNSGLSHNIDREVSIIARKGAFAPASPLAMPETLQGRNVSPSFTSPLDRLRRMSEMTGMQQLVQFAALLQPIDPAVIARLDGDEMIEVAQAVLGAPAKSLKSRDVSAAARQQNSAATGVAQSTAAATGAGQAMESLGKGAVAGAQGAQAAQSPAFQAALANTALAAQRFRAAAPGTGTPQLPVSPGAGQ